MRRLTTQRWFIHCSLLLCAVTGVVWLVLREMMVDRIPHAGDRWVLILHGLGGFLALIALGSVLPTHVRAAWRAGRNRISGGIVLGMMVLLAATAFGLYYGNETLHLPIKWIHIILGLLGVFSFPIHIFFGRKSSSTIP